MCALTKNTRWRRSSTTTRCIYVSNGGSGTIRRSTTQRSQSPRRWRATKSSFVSVVGSTKKVGGLLAFPFYIIPCHREKSKLLTPTTTTTTPRKEFWSFLICILGVVLVSEAKTCQETAPQLYRAVWRFTWTAFALALACLVTSVSTAIFVYLMRHGHLSTSAAAPQAIQRCRVVKYKPPRSEEDEALLASDGEDPNGEAEATCPICMEPFDAHKEIRATPCRHVFHSQCLAGWLNVSRCCPMCRHDFLGDAPPPRRPTMTTTTTATATATSSGGNRRSAAGGNRRRLGSNSNSNSGRASTAEEDEVEQQDETL